MIVVVENVVHQYGSRTALAGVSFQVPEGEIFGLLGPNGSGKSTLFKILSTLMAPVSGKVTIAGFDAATQPAKVRRAIGVVFQSHSLDKKLTVDENLVGQGHLFGLSGAVLRGRIEEAMKRLGLTERRNDLTGQLSGGLRRRVEICKALLHKPSVLLMDEPSTGLDPAARRELSDYMEDLRRENGMTILVTTHILDEADRCDRLLLLHEGKVVAEGTPAELKARVGGDVVIFEVKDAASMQKRLADRFGVAPQVIDGTVRVEMANGHRFIAEVVEAFPGEVASVAYHKPTLEDVFLDQTGAQL